MKHLEKFFEYIRESREVSNDDLEDILVPFTDMGIKFELSNEKTATKGRFAGKKFRSVDFFLITTPQEPGFHKWSNIDVTFDNKVWEFLDELITVKSRLESYSDNEIGFYINQISGTSASDSGWRASIFFITGEDEMGEEFELKRLYKDLESKYNTCRSDFCYYMINRLDIPNKQITIKADNYTDRKWKTFTRGIDLSKFDVSTSELPSNYSFESCTLITIKLKNDI